QRTVSGLVSDPDGIPLPGVTVSVKNGSAATATDNQGRYTLQVPPDAAALVFSMIGFEPYESAVGASAEINVTLRPSLNDLDEVVVIGYGTARKSDLTGAVSSVSA